MKHVVIGIRLMRIKDEEFLKLKEHTKKIQCCSSWEDTYTDLIADYVDYCESLTKKYKKTSKEIDEIFTY